jgi:hypothetical protein
MKPPLAVLSVATSGVLTPMPIDVATYRQR